MLNLTDEELLQEIETGEADRVELKENLSGNAKESAREAICAFANDLPNYEKPGLLFVGVRNDRTIVGIQVTDELLQQLANMKTDGNIVPPPSLIVQKRTFRGKEEAVVAVQPSDSPPVRFKGAIRIRV